MSGYLALRAVTYRTHSLNLIHLELPPSFTARLIDFRFPLNVFPILRLFTRSYLCLLASLLTLLLLPTSLLACDLLGETLTCARRCQAGWPGARRVINSRVVALVNTSRLKQALLTPPPPFLWVMCT